MKEHHAMFCIFGISISLFSSRYVFFQNVINKGFFYFFIFFRNECMFLFSKYMSTRFSFPSLFSFCIFLLLQSEEDKDVISLPSFQNIFMFKFYCGYSLQALNTPVDKHYIQNRLLLNLNYTGTQL